jgi:hypothetical protein
VADRQGKKEREEEAGRRKDGEEGRGREGGESGLSDAVGYLVLCCHARVNHSLRPMG